jgi:hypothetical protein
VEGGSAVLKTLIAAILSAILVSAPVATGEADPSPEAMTFVAGFSDDHLSGMLSRIGGRSSTMVALSQVDGALAAAVFDVEIDRAVVKYGPAWQRNLALSWTPLLTSGELSSLTIAGAQSPHTEKYLSLRGAAGQTMQQLSQDLFHEVLTEVVRNTVAELTPGQPAQ